jgi:hypothetical protein
MDAMPCWGSEAAAVAGRRSDGDEKRNSACGAWSLESSKLLHLRDAKKKETQRARGAQAERGESFRPVLALLGDERHRLTEV